MDGLSYWNGSNVKIENMWVKCKQLNGIRYEMSTSLSFSITEIDCEVISTAARILWKIQTRRNSQDSAKTLKTHGKIQPQNIRGKGGKYFRCRYYPGFHYSRHVVASSDSESREGLNWRENDMMEVRKGRKGRWWLWLWRVVDSFSALWFLLIFLLSGLPPRYPVISLTA